MRTGCSVFEVHEYRLVVHNIVVAFVNASAVVAVAFKQIYPVFICGVFNSLKLIPNIKGPTLRLIKVESLCRISACVNKRAVYKTCLLYTSDAADD